MIGNSRCARCGQIGHWARTCTNEPYARGKANAGKKATMASLLVLLSSSPHSTV
jgi:hypothetical protein